MSQVRAGQVGDRSCFATASSGTTSRLHQEGGQGDRIVSIAAGDEHPAVEQERRGGAIADRDGCLERGGRARRRIERPGWRHRWRRTSRRRAATDRPGARTGSGPGSRPPRGAGTCPSLDRRSRPGGAIPAWIGAVNRTRPSGSRVASPGYVICGAPVAANWFEARVPDDGARRCRRRARVRRGGRSRCSGSCRTGSSATG